ncbi:MAG TPA: flavodoxin family protein [Acidiferrobacterales bacterium]|jgi:multimeric flavodoxin WrbA
MNKVIVVYHSGFGHTQAQARAVVEGAQRVAGTQARAVPVEDIERDWPALDAADAIIFGSPTYMGGVSAGFKAFMDASSKRWAERAWEGKLAAGFTNSASLSGDKLNTLVQLSVFAAQHGMHWINLGLMPGNNSSTGSPEDLNRLGSYLGAMAQSNADQGADVVPPRSDLRTAAHLGERVAEMAAMMARGRVTRAA